ncbi:Peptidyl-prolyl cis-trans isomerase [Zostera marina]|uniref:Peptidyl-prolyl cis-trans isomerase n=1 Tax=Zostera marina TaxID=29655 RepID=A0A0K9NWE9_ZOSMR|nr:Peptidyl-prolyl cis-trans isomerase [Zostera marina]
MDDVVPEVTLETSMGPVRVEMYCKHAPKTCRNFLELSRRGYYDNVKFHRIIKNFIVQGGDPTGTGRGGESIYGAKFEDEIRPELKHTGAGILSMANAGPNTNGSQFFITLAPAQSLDGKHTIFGRISGGMEIIKRLGSVQTDNSDRPIHDVKILRTSVKD